MKRLACFGLLALPGLLQAQVDSSNVDIGALPDTPEGFGVNIVAKEPHFINPAALAFDKQGRLFVGAGPQYRKPSKETPPDYIKILHDEDEDGVAEKVTTFAEGFNNIQALAWKGDELWVANAPDVTVLRDTDGDLVADEYELIYTGLGHLRHGLHGFNWAPDGRLYMTQGNSRVQDHAPKAFRELMGIKSDKPDNQPLNEVYTAETYKKSYIGGWPSAEGGILRCEDGGKNLEIYSRGLRNSWDMAMDTSFNWICTDNDPGPQHDRIFMPFLGAHFGMSHAWSFDWMAKDHLPTAPSISKLPTVSGSGVGVVYYTHTHFPEKYQNSFIIGDWTNKCIYHFPTTWEGAQMKSEDAFETLADAGRTQAGDLGYKPKEGKSLFRPTDIAVAPSGALYVAGWGAHYGSVYASFGGADSRAKKNYGRVFRIFHKERPLHKKKDWLTAKRSKPHSRWTFQELLDDLGAQIPAWRVNAQEELIQRGTKHVSEIIKAIQGGQLSEGQETWAAWALSRITGESSNDFNEFEKWSKAKSKASLNLRIQSTRILGESSHEQAFKSLAPLLSDNEPRVRLAAAIALRNLKKSAEVPHEPLLRAMATEKDRLCLYAQWHTLGKLLTADQRRPLLKDERAGVRLGSLLSLLEEDALDKFTVLELGIDPEESVASIAQSWLKKNGGGTLPGVAIDAPRRNFREPVEATLKPTVGGFEVRYTLDGSEPSEKSQLYKGTLKVEDDLTLRAALFKDGKRRSSVAEANFHRITDAEWEEQVFIQEIKVKSGHNYEVVEMGLQPGVKVYTDREFTYGPIPPEVQGLTYIRTANDDKNSRGEVHLTFDLNLPATIYVAHDERLPRKPKWMADYTRTELLLPTSDVPFRLYKLDVLGGETVLGGNAENAGSRASMYQVLVQRTTAAGKTTADSVNKILASGKTNSTRGEQIFFGKGACMACHRVQGKGQNLGPDLSDMGLRAKTEYIIRAILDPSADIIEGYQQAHLQLKSGGEVFGMVQGETAKSLKIYLADGSARDIAKGDIQKRTILETSGMPPSYPFLLSAQDTADLTAWLLQQRTRVK